MLFLLTGISFTTHNNIKYLLFVSNSAMKDTLLFIVIQIRENTLA